MTCARSAAGDAWVRQLREELRHLSWREDAVEDLVAAICSARDGMRGHDALAVTGTIRPLKLVASSATNTSPPATDTDIDIRR